jgi:flagellar hook-associated protein 3 FlgL
MKTSFISTPALFRSNRFSLIRMQAELAVRQNELASGRHDDQGVTLGAQLSRVISLRGDHDRLQMVRDTNHLLLERLETSQNAMATMQVRAEDFRSQMIRLSDGDLTADITVVSGQSALAGFIGDVNAVQDGQYLFAGINSAVAPLEDYFGPPPSAGKLAVDAAFLGHFGFSQSDPAVAGITAADMQAFLDGPFDALFAAGGWTANFSSADDQNPVQRIAPGGEVEAGASANQDAFRDMAKAFIMTADLGADRLDVSARNVVLDAAITTVSEGLGEMILVRSDMGINQQRVARSNDALELQLAHLNDQVVRLEGVDPYETASRINLLISQIETSYALTARISQLSLANRL